MKSYTNIEQSEKLAEILPIESADMCYSNSPVTDIINTDNYTAILHTVKEMKDVFDKRFHQWDTYWKLIPCWSLAALLNMLKDNIKIEKTLFDQSDMFTYSILGDGYDYRTNEHENLVDACVEMILKLHELNLLQL